MSILNHIIPAQKPGSYIGASSNVESESRHAALVLFNEAKMRLLDINNWGRLYEAPHTEFRLTDEFGVLLQETPPAVGNLIRMRLPLTNGTTDDRFSWVRIENFESTKDLLKDEEIFGFCVKPVSGPIQDSSDVVAYTGNVVSYFMLCRKSSSIMAVEQERDEAHADTHSLLDKIKNLVSDIIGSLKLSRSRWKRLMSGILRPSLN